MSDQNIHFTVIVTTHKRPEIVLKCISSVAVQTYTNWHLEIVIDDITSNYSKITSLYGNIQNITVRQNTANIGKNASINSVLNSLSHSDYSGYIVYLDDDDWLDENCLMNLYKELLEKPDSIWIVSNRSDSKKNIPFTKIKTQKNTYNYSKDVLLLKKFYGDATHCISFRQTKKCRFPIHIKNAEEWIYFSQLSKHTNFIYLNKAGTLSNGYSTDGLTYNRINDWKNYWGVVVAVVHHNLFSPYVTLYLIGRLMKMIRNQITSLVR